MQVRQVTKQKYNIADFIQPGNAPISRTLYKNQNKFTKLQCICSKQTKETSHQCTRCKKYIHRCLNKENISEDWECLHCQSVNIDPVFSVDTILLETMFKTESIFQYFNQIEFQFNITAEQMNNLIELRGLKYGRIGLAWPMQGQLYLNRQINSQPFYSFKPLLANSNRKHRKEQALIIPQKLLNMGKNILEFRIPRLNSRTFVQKYQCEERGYYFFGIYSINKLKKDELIAKTFQKSRIDKKQSLELLKKVTGFGDEDVSVQKIKLNLQCPYSKLRIKVPVRGKKCPHYTCLCLETLIQTRASMPGRDWNCPICQRKVNEPIIDMFILSILNDGTGGIEVMLSITGEYTWLAFTQNSDSDENQSVMSKQSKKKLAPPIIQEILSQSPVRKVAKKHQKKPEIVQIDLDSPPPSNPPLQIIIADDIPAHKKIENSEINRQKVREAMKMKREKAVVQNQNVFMITDIRNLEFRSITFKEYSRNFNIQYQPRANKISDDLNYMFAEFKEIL